MKKLLIITFLAITYIAQAQEFPLRVEGKTLLGTTLWAKIIVKLIPVNSANFDCYDYDIIVYEPFKEIVNTEKTDELFEEKGEENTIVFYFTFGTHGKTEEEKKENMGVVLLSKNYTQIPYLNYVSEIQWKKDEKSELPIPNNGINITERNNNGISIKKWMYNDINIEKWAHLIDEISIGRFHKTENLLQHIYESVGMQKPETEIPDTLQRAITAQKMPAYDEGVVINGVKWATMNVGANNPEDYGIYHKWWVTRSICPCPDGWRLPTEEEIEKLINSGSQWTTVNGVSGRKFGSGKDTIFLPAAGYNNIDLDGTDSGIVGGGTDGLYRSVKIKGSVDMKDTVLMGFDKDVVKVVDFPFGFCISVRCVAE